MLTLTSSAADVVSAVKERENVPDGYGLRVFAQQGADGTSVRLAFAEEPGSDDHVAESQGQRLFVSPELAEPLNDSVLDAQETAEGVGLVLRQPETP